MNSSDEDLTLQALCARGKKKSSLMYTVRRRLCTEQKIKKSCVSSRLHLSLVYFSQSFHCKPARMGEFLEPLSALAVNFPKLMVLIPFRLSLMLSNLICSCRCGLSS